MPTFVFDKNLGAIETVPPWALPEGYVASAVNVNPSASSLMLPRIGTSLIGGTGSPPDEGISQLFTAAGVTVWAVNPNTVGVTQEVATYTGGAWTAVTLSDTVALTGLFTFAAYNGKVFIAYNSDQNRLHVWDGTSVRRVGVVASAAPSVANTGAGAYAATLRYYKVQFLIRDAGGTIYASSELSASTSFTPSGAGTAARITKPTTPDSATYWRVYGSTDNITFYDISGVIAVGTTTYDDSTTPSAYSGGTVAPEAGLFVPPPSAKFLATNGERLFMAGSWETSASSGQTTPANRRVWFTRPLGATDAGDDEAITQTTNARYWIDIEQDDGAIITALVSTAEGAVYAGTATGLWRLNDTGLADVPIRAERVVAGVGPASARVLVSVDSPEGSVIYFSSANGPYRYSPVLGVQYLGADWVMPYAGAGYDNAPESRAVGYDPETRCVFWSTKDTASPQTVGNVVRRFDPSLCRVENGIVRGGWSKYVYGYGATSFIGAFTTYAGQMWVGGDDGSGGDLLFKHSASVTTDNSVAYTASVSTPYVTLDDGAGNLRVDDPYLYKARNLGVALTANRNRGGTNNTTSVTLAAETVAGGEARSHRVKAENLTLADAYTVAFDLSVTTPVVTPTDRHNDGIDRLVVPVVAQERG